MRRCWPSAPEKTAMNSFNHIVVLVTAGDEEEARLIAGILLEQRKAACVNIVSGVNSLFRWQDRLETETESLLVIKTTASMLEAVIETVREVHSYETPEIIALPVIGGSGEYLEWLEESVSSEDSSENDR
ncbi:CutA1 divalent ion tolerance protein [Dehalogenimonas lykanthroporepellens BL-DC-9]|nr:CutA1 divalent ion tolerance protein [Dehalogenimonas lykanthroporepellens BL-DC-9]